MKRADFTPCIVCGNQVGFTNPLVFRVVTLQRMMFDHRAIQQTAGLELMLQSPALADVFAPDTELAKPLGEPEKFLLCEKCSLVPFPIAAMDEMAIARRCTDDADGEPTAPAAPNDQPPGEAA
jgi:hypothetical protein